MNKNNKLLKKIDIIISIEEGEGFASLFDNFLEKVRYIGYHSNDCNNERVNLKKEIKLWDASKRYRFVFFIFRHCEIFSGDFKSENLKMILEDIILYALKPNLNMKDFELVMLHDILYSLRYKHKWKNITFKTLLRQIHYSHEEHIFNKDVSGIILSMRK